VALRPPELQSYTRVVRAEIVKQTARDCGFELVGVAPANGPDDFPKYEAWVAKGFAAEMRYLTDHRADKRRSVQNVLPGARSVICVGKLYNTPSRDSLLSRYAWGQDYHEVLRAGLTQLAERLHAIEQFDYKICVDSAPVLERSLARQAGLGWIGKNTCLIHEPLGSWFFLGELITSLELEPDTPPPDRCGSCTRCIDACPTQALVPDGEGWTLDSRRCISYLTIELRGSIPEEHRAGVGEHLFGCDVCQDVCPWNARAPVTDEVAFQPAPLQLEQLAALSEQEFRRRFAASPLLRAKHAGILRNSAVVMGNIDPTGHRETLQVLAQHADPMVREHAEWALARADAGDNSLD
jgi:epoxyqueuosine reductase